MKNKVTNWENRGIEEKQLYARSEIPQYMNMISPTKTSEGQGATFYFLHEK
jgi:hypothetical protein